MKSIPVADPNITKRKSMIAVRNGFSDEKGISAVSHQIQLTEFDYRTRIILSNKIFSAMELFFNTANERQQLSHLFCRSILSEVFMERTTLPEGKIFVWRVIFDDIHNVIINAPYNEVLDIIWYISNWLNIQMKKYFPIFCEIINNAFETECVGYRFVSGKIVEITDSTEIDAIEEAANSQFDGCRNHINNAIGFLADRDKKDYKNCVKESISAVESICKVITQNDHATLGDALKELEKKRGLKGPLKAAFEKLYSYTNDKGGVRHADGLFVSEVDFEEAKFMLVSCSAFVNYLIAEYGKIDGDKQ